MKNQKRKTKNLAKAFNELRSSIFEVRHRISSMQSETLEYIASKSSQDIEAASWCDEGMPQAFTKRQMALKVQLDKLNWLDRDMTELFQKFCDAVENSTTNFDKINKQS